MARFLLKEKGEKNMHVMSGFIRAGVREIFSTMVGTEVVCDESKDDNFTTQMILSGVSGTVSVTGKMTGSVYINFTANLANKVAAKIMGSDSLSDSEVNDVVGELTNMVTGNLKSKMADKGFNCALSIPTVIRGQDVQINPKDAPISLQSHFKSAEFGEIFTVDCFTKLDGELK